MLLTAEFKVVMLIPGQGTGWRREGILILSIPSHLSLKVKENVFTTAFQKAKTVSLGSLRVQKGN